MTTVTEPSVPSLVSTKQNPICLDPTMMAVSISPDELSSWAFSSGRQQSLVDAVGSRHGREHQRWLGKTRLTTGVVPITRDGRVLLISSTKKSEWILPKGGWEQDETLEESALREAHEEAGVFGVLGPALSPITYETRKARQRRTSSKLAPTAVVTPESSDASTASTAGSGLEYTHVQSTLFPLYVTRVEHQWPESGRLRRLVSVEQAIELLEKRPEQQEIVREVQQRGLAAEPALRQHLER